VVRFKSNLPGYVSATAQPPGGPEAPVLAPQLAGTEIHSLTLPGASRPGPYALTLTADSGPGRTATLTVTPVVADPAAPSGDGRGGAGTPPAGGLFGSGLPGGGLLDVAGVAGGLLDVAGVAGGPPEAKNVPGGLYQALMADERPSGAARASRSSAVRPIGSSPSGPVPGPSDRYGLGVMLAALTGFALWRFRARTPSARLVRPQ
jgi:hypothetical protein